MPAAQTGSASLDAPVASLARIERYLSLPLVFGLLGAATFLVAWNRGIAFLYALFALLVGSVIVSLVGARWMLRRAAIRLALPAEAAVGDEITALVSIVPRARPRRRRLLELRSLFAFAPGRLLFLSASQPGLLHSHRVRCTRRGVFRVQEAAVTCAYPFGLWSATRSWPVDSGVIVVHPRTYPVTRFLLPAGSARTSGELERPVPSVGQELFRETREYRSGDNPRHIHWASSARHGRLIVRQFDAIASTETWIVLDLDPGNHAGEGEDHSFERSVEIAASIAAHLVRSGLRCAIAGGLREGAPALRVPPGSGNAHLKAVMDALAGVQADCRADYASALAAVAPYYRRGQQWILFQHGTTRLSTPAFLRAEQPLWFRFDTQSFARDDGSDGRAQPPLKLADGFSISRATDLAALFR